MRKIYGYMRVSTTEKSAKQDYERQKGIFATSGIKFAEIFEEHVSGGVKADNRPEFRKLLDKLQHGDLVCFSETSRFGRNYIDCFQMIDAITQDIGADIRFLSNNFELKGNGQLNPYEWLTVSQFFIMDEFQKRQIGFNTKNALARKRSQGVVLGRPEKKSIYAKQVQQLYDEGKRQMEIADQLGIGLSTVRRILKEAYVNNEE